jgi:hypothetical protein
MRFFDGAHRRPIEFAFLVDLDNDGKGDDLLPQFTGAAGAPLTWYG